MTDEQLDVHLDNILKAAGSALKHYSMQKTKNDMRQALREALAKEKALQALHNENERLGLYKDAYAQPEQKPVKMVAYNCTCGRTMKFESVHGVVAPQRTWVELTDEEELQLAGMMDKSRHWLVAEVGAKLKQKNGYAEEKNT